MNILTYLRARSIGDEGAVSTEYVFLLVLIALVIVLGVTAFGTAVSERFVDGAEQVRTAGSRD